MVCTSHGLQCKTFHFPKHKFPIHTCSNAPEINCITNPVCMDHLEERELGPTINSWWPHVFGIIIFSKLLIIHQTYLQKEVWSGYETMS